MVQDDDIPLAGSDLFELLFGQEFPVVDQQRGAERQPTQAIEMAASAAGPAGTGSGVRALDLRPCENRWEESAAADRQPSLPRA